MTMPQRLAMRQTIRYPLELTPSSWRNYHLDFSSSSSKFIEINSVIASKGFDHKVHIPNFFYAIIVYFLKMN